MVAKSVLMLSLFILPIAAINLGIVQTGGLLFLTYLTAGLGMAGIGMGIMHDAIHGSYSKNKAVNKFMGYTMNLVGASSTVWRIQHNVLHHSYPNIAGADDDLNMPFLLRFSPSIKRHWLHRYQFVYVWVFYCLSTISWITSKDFIRIKRYKKMGFLEKKNEYQKEISILILSKFLYYCFVLILPLIVVPLPFWLILLAFFSMHLMTGFLISTVFQIAHIMPGMAFPEPDENGLIAGDWSLHQMATTTNFSPKSRFFSWLIGGLNYQVEHHLLPNICHIHYRELSPIVATTAREYGMPYHTKKTFRGALWGHIKMLHHLGKKEGLKV